MTQIYETDWLASRPIFYNERTRKVSHNMNDLIDFANVEIDPEGFNNYLDFGYSVFGQTPVRHIKFLRHSSRLTAHNDGHLEIESLSDPVEEWVGRITHEDDVLQWLETSIRCWEKSVDGEIIIPTSGGYDSRLLNFLIEDKSRIRSFTYGISENQAESYEVVYARKLSQILGSRWEHILLGDYHLYFNEWDLLFGASTHAHGMYHFEFYHKILPKVSGGNPFLSGIIGDAWAGSVKMLEVNNSNQLSNLGYTHGLRIDPQKSLLKDDGLLRESYFGAMRDKIRQPLFNVVEAMRFKIVLLTYLMVLPDFFGFKPWSPFLDIAVALGMATLPPERRKDRLWQKEFFHKVGLDLESMHLPTTLQNTLDLQALHRIPVRPLDVNILREVIRPDYVEWINRNLLSHPSTWTETAMNKMSHFRKVGGILKRIGFKDQTSICRKAYSAYCVLLPVENVLRKRNQS